MGKILQFPIKKQEDKVSVSAITAEAFQLKPVRRRLVLSFEEALARRRNGKS